MCDADTLEQQQFLLGYYGKGTYPLSVTDSMTLDDMNRHAKMLMDRIQAEREAHEEAVKAAKSKKRR